MITYTNNAAVAGTPSGDETYLMFLAVGGILYFVVFLAVAILNYSLAGSYMIKYEEVKGNHFDRKEVWDLFKNRLGSIVLFILLLILIYIGVSIVGFVLMLIPLLGIFAYYILLFFILAWFGVSFFCMLEEQKGVTEAFGEGWNLVYKNFWKSVGVNFILGFLNGILVFIVLMVPIVIVGVYTFHVVENNVDVEAGIVPTIIYTLGTYLMLIVGVYGQCLSQFVNGMLYYSLHEKAYNTNTRSKIDQIGNTEQ
jgi:amino acid transporter